MFSGASEELKVFQAGFSECYCGTSGTPYRCFHERVHELVVGLPEWHRPHSAVSGIQQSINCFVVCIYKNTCGNAAQILTSSNQPQVGMTGMTPADVKRQRSAPLKAIAGPDTQEVYLQSVVV